MLEDFVDTIFKSYLQTYDPSCTPVSKRRRGGTAGLIDSMVSNRLVISTSDEEDSADNIYQRLKRYLSEDVIDRKKRIKKDRPLE